MANLCKCGCGELVKGGGFYKAGHKKLVNLCLCGCGTLVAKKWKRGHYLKYKKPENYQINFCACGCKELTNPGRKYILGHVTKGRRNRKYKKHSIVWNNICKCGCGQKSYFKYAAGHNPIKRIYSESERKIRSERMLGKKNSLGHKRPDSVVRMKGNTFGVGYKMTEEQRDFCRQKAIKQIENGTFGWVVSSHYFGESYPEKTFRNLLEKHLVYYLFP